MKFLELLGELLLVYILYKVIFGFIIPIYQTTKQVKTKMNDLHSRMQEQQRTQASQEPVKKSTSISKDDYIDYEEVK
jgi:capsular polysaccharide biosynthesis protein